MSGVAHVPGQPRTGPELDNRRVIAALIDLAAIGLLAVALGVLLGGPSGVLVPVALGWVLYYFFAFESGDGQTPGKRVMHLRVVRADGEPAGMREIAVRTVLRVVDGFGLYLVGLVVMMATGKRRQRLGDLAAGTVVTDAEMSDGADEPVVQAVAEVEPPAAVLEPEPEPLPPVVDVAETDVSPDPEPEPGAEPASDPEPAEEPDVDEEPARAPWPLVEAPAAPEAHSDEEDAGEPEDPGADGRETTPRLKIVSNPIELIMGEHDGDDGPPDSSRDRD